MTLRIVGAGLGRTGTSSLQVALEELLGGPCYHMSRAMRRPDDVAIWRALAEGGPAPNWTDMFASFDATLDWPAASYWEQIAAAYPDAFVLLSTRSSADEWYASFERTIVPVLLDKQTFSLPAYEMARVVTFNTFTDRVTDPDVCKRAYDEHNAHVRATVPPDRLIEWQPGDGWKPLCDALGVDVPDAEFPHVNAGDEFRDQFALDRDEPPAALVPTRPPLNKNFRWRMHVRLRRLRHRALVATSAGRKRVFTKYFQTNHWGDPESVSGPGSNLEATKNIRKHLPSLFERHGIRVLLDVPCGDAGWMREIDHELEQYIGVDVVPSLVDQLKATARANETFLCLDAISDPLPKADAVMCRDFFIHLSERHIEAVLSNVRRSGARYLVASNYPEHENKAILMTGFFRAVNLETAPYNLGKPIDSIWEDYPKHPDKVLALWELR